MAFLRAFVLTGFALAVGVLVYLLLPRGTPLELRPSFFREAWPFREPPYVLLFTDPRCPFCRALERELAKDSEIEELVRYVPVMRHEGSYEDWLLRLISWGWEEEVARAYLERMRDEMDRAGLRITPVAVVVNKRGEVVRVVGGFGGYGRWREEVLDALRADR
jgi:hypothetical protein